MSFPHLPRADAEDCEAMLRQRGWSLSDFEVAVTPQPANAPTDTLESVFPPIHPAWRVSFRSKRSNAERAYIARPGFCGPQGAEWIAAMAVDVDGGVFG
jgi:hypothetical protein